MVSIVVACAAALSLFSAAAPHEDVVYGQGHVAPAPDSKEYHPKDLLLDVTAPRGDGPHPAVVLVHGGSFQGGDKDNKKLASLADALADEGFACFSINYRLTGDNPPAPAPWSNTLLQSAIHASFVDTKAAIRFVRANAAAYRVDPARIAVLGESAGAFSALAAGLSDADDYANDGPGFAPLEKNNPGVSSAVRAIIDLWGNAELVKDKFSPGDPPVLIVHGTADFHIGTFFTAALNIEAACKANNIPVTLVPIEGGGHGCWDGKGNGRPISEIVASFLRDTMKAP